MRRALLALALLLVVGTDARALTDAVWNQKQHAANFPLDQLPAPSAAASPSTAPVRPIDLNPAGAPCILSAPGANGLPVCATPLASLSVTDPISSTGGASPTLGLKFTNVDLILTGPGALEVAAFTGAVTKAAGATSTIFGSAGAHTVLANLTGGLAVPTFTGPATGGQFLGDSGWASVPTTSITGLAAIATSGSATDLIAGTVPAARVPAFVGAITTAGGTLTTAFGTQAGNSFFGVAGSSTAVPAAISCATPGTFAGNVAGTLGCTATIPATSAPLAAGAVGFGSAGGLLTGDATNFHWDPTNFRFGLGLSAPAYQLHLRSQSTDADFANRGFTSTVYNGATNSSPLYRMQTAAGTAASPSIVPNTSYAGTLAYEVWDGTQWLRTVQTGAHVRLGTTPGVGSVQTDWYVYDTASGLADPYGGAGANLALEAQGSVVRVGYNPVTPGTLGTVTNGVLQVYGSLAATTAQIGPFPSVFSISNGKIVINNDASANNARLYIGHDGSAGVNSAAVIQLFNDNAAPNNQANIEFYTKNNVVYGPSALVIGDTLGDIFWEFGVSGNIYERMTNDGSMRWYDSTAAVSASGTAALRSFSGGTLQYSENGGAWVSFDSLVPSSRTVQGTAPISIGGGHSALDLSSNRVWSLDTNGVTNSFLAQMDAATLKGNNGGSLANAADLTATQVTAMLNPFTSSLQGLAPSSGGGTSNFLRADGAWVVPPGTGVPTARTLTMTAPMTCDGGGSCDLSSNRTIATPVFAGSAAGLVPASAGGTTNFLRADGTYAVPSGTGTSGITQLTGDGTAGPGSGSQAFTLATVNANVGSFTFANVTVNAKGLVTAASSGTVYNQTIQANGTPQTQEPIFNFDANFSLSVGGGKNTISLGGPLSPSSTFGSAGQFIQAFTTDASGRVAGATPTNFPASTELLIASGAAPVGDATLTYNTSTDILAAGAAAINGTSAPTNVMFIAGHTTNGNRDRAQWFLGGGGLPSTGTTGDSSLMEIFAASTAVSAGVTAGIYSTLRVGAATYTGTGQTITEAASLYIPAAPTLSTVSGQDYAIHVASGPVRFDGNLAFTLFGAGMLTTDSSGNVSPAGVVTASQDYYVSTLASGLVGTGKQWLIPSSTLTGSIAIEQPHPIVMTRGELCINVVTNPIVSGSLAFIVTRNGSDISGSVINLNSAVTGAQCTSSFATSSSGLDTYGVYVTGSGTVVSGNLQATVDIQLSKFSF